MFGSRYVWAPVLYMTTSDMCLEDKVCLGAEFIKFQEGG